MFFYGFHQVNFEEISRVIFQSIFQMPYHLALKAADFYNWKMSHMSIKIEALENNMISLPYSIVKKIVYPSIFMDKINLKSF